jgi:hypothetical protein
MVTDQKHPSDISSEQEVIRYTEKLAQAFGLNEQNAEMYSTLSGENRALKKQLEDYYSQHSTLERKVKRLERDVGSIKTELGDLDKCVDRETVVDLIQKIVSSLVREKSLIKNNPSSSSSDYSSDSDIDEIVKMIKHQRIQIRSGSAKPKGRFQKKNVYHQLVRTSYYSTL